MTLVSVNPGMLLEPRRIVTFEPGPPPFQPVVLGGQFVSNGYFPQHTLTVADTFGRIQGHFAAGHVPADDSIDHPMLRVRMNRNRVAVDPSHTRLVLAYQAFNRFDIFDSVPKFRGTFAGPRTVVMSFKRINSKQGAAYAWADANERAYVGVDATKEHIFALFCGRCGNDLPRIVHVFTWEGRFVHEIVLDQGISSIAVSPNGSDLFGATLEPFPAIAQWNLPLALSSKH